MAFLNWWITVSLGYDDGVESIILENDCPERVLFGHSWYVVL